MAAADLNEWGPETGSEVDDARVVLGAVMMATIAVVAAAMYLVGPAAGAKTAAAMTPFVLVSALRTPLADCSIYGGGLQR
jgi:hypothetical protein